MSYLIYQPIYEFKANNGDNNGDNINKENKKDIINICRLKAMGVEILAGTKLLDDLVNILSLNNDFLRDRGIYGFDEKILNLLYKNQDSIKSKLKGYKNVSMNIYPESLLKIVGQSNQYLQPYKYLKELSKNNIITHLEIIENGLSVRELFNERHDILKKTKEELGLLLSLDDVSIFSVEEQEEKKFQGKIFIDQLDKYIDYVDKIKIDLKITKLIIESDKYMKFVFQNINKLKVVNKNRDKKLSIIFEGIETEEEFDKFRIIIENEYKTNPSFWENINIGFQGYYFSKPLILI